MKNSALRMRIFRIHAGVAKIVALTKIAILGTVLLPTIANATLLNKTIYANPASGLWRYSYDQGPNVNVSSSSVYPTSPSQHSSATFVGYVKGPDTTTSIAADLWQGAADSRTVRVFGTYVISNIPQTITLSLTGDDGHSAFVNGTFVAGGGFSVRKLITLSLHAYVPVLLEVVGYNYSGGSVWALGTCNEPCSTGSAWTKAVEDLPGITITPVLTPCEEIVDGSTVRFMTSGAMIEGIVTPKHGYSVRDAATLCGYAHFNWKQIIKTLMVKKPDGSEIAYSQESCEEFVKPCKEIKYANGTWVTGAVLDPPYNSYTLGPTPGTLLQVDSHPWYWDVPFGLCPGFNPSCYVPDTYPDLYAGYAYFKDAPCNGANFRARFVTQLFGVRSDTDYVGEPVAGTLKEWRYDGAQFAGDCTSAGGVGTSRMGLIGTLLNYVNVGDSTLIGTISQDTLTDAEYAAMYGKPPPGLGNDYARNSVQKAYVAYYGRPADPSGLDYWTSRTIAAGGSLVAVIGAFGSSDEFQRRFGGLSFDVLVSKIYQQALGRDPDSAGLTYYVTELQAGRRTLQSITLDVLNGATTPPDSTIVANKLEVAAYYTTRVASGCPYGTEQDGVDAIAGVTASATSASTAKAVIDVWCAP